jgi:hypothetical protein
MMPNGKKNRGISLSRSGVADQEAQRPSPTHRLTLELTRAENLAVMLANSRGAAVVEISDLLAGMYIYDWERLSKYWDYEDQVQVEEVLRRICEISPQRWHYWIELYDKKRRDGEKQASWFSFLSLLSKDEKNESIQKPLGHSGALADLLRKAEEISPFRDKLNGCEIPILTSECVLLCMVRTGGSEISAQLAHSGLNLPKLEQAALTTRRGTRD